MTATDAAFDSPTEAVTGTLPTLSNGVHSIYVRGRDSVGNWGPLSSTTVSTDTAGPVSTGLSLTPNPTNGSVSVAVHATASDTTTGGAGISAAEYFIDGAVVDGAGTTMVVNNPGAVTASVDATIAAATINALSEGSHTVKVHGQDSVGNWGPVASIILTVDKTGPATGAVTATPNPTNGVIGVNSSTPVVRVTATPTDAASKLVRAEGFIDSVGAPGTGFLFVPADGAWTSMSEPISADIPLLTIKALADGPHTISVRAKDYAGNWGPTSSVTLTVDKTAPLLSGLTVSNGPAAQTVTLTVNATDATTGVNRVEYFIGADPGTGLATALTLGITPSYSAAISTINLPEGTSTVSVRARDGAGNWSALATTTFTVVRDLSFSTLGNTNPPAAGGTADDSDVYRWNGAFSRTVDLTTLGVPASANVDGLVVIDPTHFYVSFTADTTISGFGTVQDEDVVFRNGASWAVAFDMTAAGLTAANLDIDEFDIVGSTLYFSTVGSANPPGVAGTADDADVYTWNGTSFARVWDATANGVPAGANVDGVSVIDPTHILISFVGDTSITGFATVQDEDVVYFKAGAWSVWFDGTAKGLTAADLDLDAIDVP
jgi:hypothetical protein